MGRRTCRHGNDGWHEYGGDIARKECLGPMSLATMAHRIGDSIEDVWGFLALFLLIPALIFLVVHLMN